MDQEWETAPASTWMELWPVLLSGASALTRWVPLFDFEPFNWGLVQFIYQNPVFIVFSTCIYR
jgi:hypothetical protein